jgi:hypothetical protein
MFFEEPSADELFLLGYVSKSRNKKYMFTVKQLATCLYKNQILDENINEPSVAMINRTRYCLKKMEGRRMVTRILGTYWQYNKKYKK